MVMAASEGPKEGSPRETWDGFWAQGGTTVGSQGKVLQSKWLPGHGPGPAGEQLGKNHPLPHPP